MEACDELKVNEKLKEERNISNLAYAPMVVKIIVYSFVGLICVAFITFLTKLALTAF